MKNFIVSLFWINWLLHHSYFSKESCEANFTWILLFFHLNSFGCRNLLGNNSLKTKQRNSLRLSVSAVDRNKTLLTRSNVWRKAPATPQNSFIDQWAEPNHLCLSVDFSPSLNLTFNLFSNYQVAPWLKQCYYAKLRAYKTHNYGMVLYFPKIIYHEIDFINIITSDNNSLNRSSN